MDNFATILEIGEDALPRTQNHANCLCTKMASTHVNNILCFSEKTIEIMSAKASTIIASAIAALKVTSSPHKINADIISLCREGRMKEAIQILNFLDHRGIQLEPVTYNSLLQICTRNKALLEGKNPHPHAIEWL